MRRSIALSSATIMSALAMTLAAPGLAFAAPPAQEACEAAGGTYTFVRGDATCVITEETNPGNPQSGNANEPFEETDITEQPGQGGGGGETSENNPNFEETDGPVLNPGGNAPGGQN